MGIKSRIPVNSFVFLVSRKNLKGSNLSVGEELMIISYTKTPAKRNDPYLERLWAVVVKLNEKGLPILPSQDKEDNAHSYIVDPRHLQIVSKERGKELNKILIDHYETIN